MALNEQALIPYIVNTLKDSQLALNLASRLGLQGAEGLYMTEFNRLVAANDIYIWWLRRSTPGAPTMASASSRC